MQEVKGNPLYLYKRYIIERHGEKAFQDVLGEATKETKEVFNTPIDVNQWYDVRVFCDFLEAFDKTLGREELIALASYTVEREISGLYGFILRFVTLQMLFSRAQDLWDKFYRPGRIHAGFEGPEIVLRIEGYSFSELQAIGFMHYIKTLIELVDKGNYIYSMKNKIQRSEYHYLRKIR